MSSNIPARAIRDAVDRRPADGLQHVDRGRRARRPDRARRDDLRLSQGPPDGAEGRGLGRRRWPGGARCRPTPARDFDTRVDLDATDIAPSVTWGTSPEDVVPITGVVPDPTSFADPPSARPRRKSLDYMGLTPGTRMQDVADRARLHRQLHQQPDRGSARRRRGRARAARSRPACRALVVPGSGLVKRQAEAEGLDRIFIDAGFEWREPGCSMCLAMNPDKVPPGERCASTSNRNFVGRQGRARARTWSARRWRRRRRSRGTLTDVRDFQ